MSENKKQINNKQKNDTQNQIKEVWASNIEQEILKIAYLLPKYNCISMDTEFPGFYFKNDQNNNFDSYALVKGNVDILKLIQVGVTLSDDAGNMPSPVHTWQFNLKFNLYKNMSCPDSIKLLKDAGIDFDMLNVSGIDHMVFAEYLTASGMVLNDKVKWITFHGAFDFAYLVKTLMNQNLPNSLEDFMTLCKIYFPTMLDTKIIAAHLDDVKGTSLQKMGNEFGIERNGIQHQAGSDAHLTLLCYHALCKKYSNGKIPSRFVNRVFGIGIDSHFYYQSKNYNFKTDSMNNYNNQMFFPNQYQYNQVNTNTHNNQEFFMNNMGQNQGYYYYNHQHTHPAQMNGNFQNNNYFK